MRDMGAMCLAAVVALWASGGAEGAAVGGVEGAALGDEPGTSRGEAAESRRAAEDSRAITAALASVRALVAGAICRVCEGSGEIERKRHLGWTFPGDGTRVPITRIERAPCTRCDATGRANADRIGRLLTTVVERIEQVPALHPRRGEILGRLDEAAQRIAGDDPDELAVHVNAAARMAAQHRASERPVVFVIGRVVGAKGSGDSARSAKSTQSSKSSKSAKAAKPAADARDREEPSAADSTPSASKNSRSGTLLEAGGVRWESVGAAVPKSHSGWVVLVGRVGLARRDDAAPTPGGGVAAPGVIVPNAEVRRASAPSREATDGQGESRSAAGDAVPVDALIAVPLPVARGKEEKRS